MTPNDIYPCYEPRDPALGRRAELRRDWAAAKILARQIAASLTVTDWTMVVAVLLIGTIVGLRA